MATGVNENEYALDGESKEILLSSQGQQVMMAWEKDYMEKCVEALAISSSSDVLEIGFGLAYSANRIQSYQPHSHTIIECDPVSLKQLRAWAVTRPNVRVVAGTWQNMLASLGEFDCIFFDDYPLPQTERDESIFSISRWHEFLDLVLNWHTKLGGRVTGYLAREIDLTREGCSVKLEPFKVEVPSNCNYFPYSHALVPLVTLIEPKHSITAFALDQSMVVPSSSNEPKCVITHPKLVELRRKLHVQKYHDHELIDSTPTAAPARNNLSRQEWIRQLQVARAKKLETQAMQ
ncbi:hypothetical protein LEN26_014098 [Aphanomyces euteiches]|nr:hypothetical protein AeMF1_021499 [Aphanomyces euteiches]KAH9108978.1 hypothetical protein LEN26_014098 [Aphanomyces euteiches]KAH9196899.1 hypothetical protein AeNC1_001102 [Aphanomyces euteiches]